MTYRLRTAIEASMLLGFIVVVVLLAVLGRPTQCTRADAGCAVGDDEVFDQNIAWASGTAFEVTLDHAATGGVTLFVPIGNTSSTSTLVDATQTLTNKTLTAPDINAGTVDAITSLTVDADLAFTGAQAVTTTAGNLSLTPAGDLILENGQNFIGDTANGNMVVGLTINQAGNVNEILAFKTNADLHPFTGVTENDTQTMFQRFNGGASMYGFAQIGNPAGLTVFAGADTPNATKATTASGVIDLRGHDESGTNFANVGADGNLLVVRNNTTTRWLVDAEGDTWQTGSTELVEIAAPGAPGANTARMYAFEGAGDGFTDLVAVFQDGSTDVFAQETTPLDAPTFRYPDDTALNVVLRKPHPGVVKVVVVFPDGTEFTIAEHWYYKEEKVLANKGAQEPGVPADWYDGIDRATGRSITPEAEPVESEWP